MSEFIGITLWADAGPFTRETLIHIACNGDANAVADGSTIARADLTVAQALEVLK